MESRQLPEWRPASGLIQGWVNNPRDLLKSSHFIKYTRIFHTKHY